MPGDFVPPRRSPDILDFLQYVFGFQVCMETFCFCFLEQVLGNSDLFLQFSYLAFYAMPNFRSYIRTLVTALSYLVASVLCPVSPFD